MIFGGSVTAIVAACAMLAGGYLFGVRMGRQAREKLRDELKRSNEAYALLKQRKLDAVSEEHAQETKQALLEMLEPLKEQQRTLSKLQSELSELTETASIDQPEEVKAHLERLVQPLFDRDDTKSLRDEMQKLVSPLIERNARNEALLRPMMERERLSRDLASLTSSSAMGRGLPSLLEAIGALDSVRFKSLVVSDDSGLPLAALERSKNAEMLSAISALSLIMADRFPSGQDKPTALVLHSETGALTLIRIFYAGERRYLLTAVSEDKYITPDLFDSIVGKIQRLLPG